MSNTFSNLWNKIKKHFSNIGLFFKKHPLFCFELFMLSLVCLNGGALCSLSLESKASLEASSLVTKMASKNKFGYSINSVLMKPRGNSDYFIFVDNDIQEYQMRNQHYDKVKNYLFIGYTPDSAYSPFLIEDSSSSKTNCSALMFESKYIDSSFYFDLPILAGHISRNTKSSTVFVLDSLASKICDTSPEDIIGKTINSKTITASGTFEREFEIGAVLDSNNLLGSLLRTYFGDFIVFVPNYNSFQLDGACYFITSKDKNENDNLFDFIFKKYKSTSTSNRYLEGGFSANYSFFEFDETQNKFVLGKTNDHINKIIAFEESALSTVFTIIGIIMVIVCLFLMSLAFVWNKKAVADSSATTRLFSTWLIISLSLLIVCLFYTFLPLPTVFIQEIISAKSMVESSVIFVCWIIQAIMMAFLSLKKINSI